MYNFTSTPVPEKCLWTTFLCTYFLETGLETTNKKLYIYLLLSSTNYFSCRYKQKSMADNHNEHNIFVFHTQVSCLGDKILLRKFCNKKQELNKKVLLPERKRHTACRIVSTRYAALSLGAEGEGRCTPHPVSTEGVPPSSPDKGVSPSQEGCGYPHQEGWGYCHREGWRPPSGRMGYMPPPPLGRIGYPPPTSRCELTNWKQYLPKSFGCGR